MQVGIDGAGERIAFVERPLNALHVYDFADGTRSVVSKGLNGAPVAATQPEISRDGRCVAFVSIANNVVADDTNEAADVFVGPAK